METLHVYESVGEIVLRKSGNTTRAVRCMSIRTQGILKRDDDGDRPIVVQVADIQSGFTDVAFPYWFDGWDRLTHDQHEVIDNVRGTFWGGYFFEIAIEWKAYVNLRSGNEISGNEHIVAAKIDGQWVPAIHDFNPLTPTLPRQRMSAP